MLGDVGQCLRLNLPLPMPKQTYGAHAALILCRPLPGLPLKESIMSPREVVECWVERFSAGDAGGLADLYYPDAVNHQVTQVPVEGRDAIRAMFEREFASADMTCIVEAIHEAGDVAALEWRDPLGLRGWGFFTVRN